MESSQQKWYYSEKGIKYREENRENINNASRKYYEKNKEKIKKRNLENYYKNHKDNKEKAKLRARNKK